MNSNDIKIVITPRAERSIKKLASKNQLKKILVDFRNLLHQSDWYKSYKIKKLVNLGFWRYKQGNLRIIFDNHGNIFEVFDVKKRNERTYNL